jgi:DNA-binding MarR family transcriptional regulator
MTLVNDITAVNETAENIQKHVAGQVAPPVPETRYDLRMLQALRQIIRAVDLHSRHLVEKHQITGPQLITLLTIEKHNPVTAGTLAALIHLSPSTMIGILDRLEAKSLVQRTRGSKDRRLVYVTLTDAGRNVVAHAPSPLQETLAEALGKLPETDRIMMVEALERIVGLMQVTHIDAAPILEIGRINSGPVNGPRDRIPHANPEPEGTQ